MNTNPKDVLKTRLAAGEISIDEYRQLIAEICDDTIGEGNSHRSNSSDGLDAGR